MLTISSIQRQWSKVTAVIAISTAISDAVDNRLAAGGSVIIPAVWTAANLGFKVCDTVGGTYVPLRDQSGALVQITGLQTGEAGSYTLPDDLFGHAFFKLWSCTSAGVDTNQAAARTFVVVQKS
jgi:hypothetical protein